MKKIKRMLSMLMVISMLFVSTSPVLAAETTNCHYEVATVENSDITLPSTRGAFPFNSSGLFSVYFTDSFTVPSTMTCSVIVCVRGEGNVDFKLNNGSRYYLEQSVPADGTARGWHINLPAGTYNVQLFASNSTYSYTIMVYEY